MAGVTTENGCKIWQNKGYRATQKSTTRWMEFQQGFSIIESHQKAELLYLKHSFLIEQPTCNCTQLKLHAF